MSTEIRRCYQPVLVERSHRDTGAYKITDETYLGCTLPSGHDGPHEHGGDE